MNETLDSNRIAALFEAAKAGQLPDGAANQHSRRAQKIRRVDFSRPTKFTTEHQRRISRIVEAFCLAAAGRLTAELRTPIELEVINTNQVTWSGAQPLAPTQSLGLTLLAVPLGTRLLMTTESSFVLASIERLLGGSSERAGRMRRFSEIDWALSRRLMEAVVHQLSVAFHDVGNIGFEVEEIDLQTDTAAIASVSEPTFVLTIEARMLEQSSTMTLMVPWTSIAPISDLLVGRESHPAGEELDESGIDRALAAAPVTLRAEVAALELPVTQILALEPGHVIRFDASATEGVSLYAENVRLGRAQPGSNGHRRAVQIASGVEA